MTGRVRRREHELLLFFVGGLGCVIGLNVAASRGREQVAITLLFGLGLLLGLALGPVLSEYASADPAAVWQAAGTTGAFVAGLGAVGYATRRNLSSWYRVLFWALLALIVFGIVAIFVSIPGGNVIWSVAGLVIFGGYTVLDFNRLRRAGQELAVPIAASIFLDVLNIFLVPAPAVRRRARLAAEPGPPAHIGAGILRKGSTPGRLRPAMWGISRQLLCGKGRGRNHGRFAMEIRSALGRDVGSPTRRGRLRRGPGGRSPAGG